MVFVLFFCLFFAAIFSGKTSSYIETFFSYFLLFAIVLFIKTKNNLSFDNSYVFLFIVLLTGIFPQVLTINTVFYANLIVLLFLRKIYSFQSPSNAPKKLFDAGLLLGIACIIEPFSLVFGILIYLSLYLHQQLTVQKTVIPMIGFATTALLFFTYCYWFEKTAWFFELLNWFSYYDFSHYNTTGFLIPIYSISFFTFIGILIKTPKALAIKNNFRLNWILILFNFICSLLLFIVVKNKDGSEFLYLLFPIAIILANLVEVYEKKWFADVFILLLIAFSFTPLHRQYNLVLKLLTQLAYYFLFHLKFLS